MGKDSIIPILAMIVLLLGIGSTVYVHALRTDKTTTDNEAHITIYDQIFTLEGLFSQVKIRTISTDEGDKTGIALDQLITLVGIECPSCYTYTIKAFQPHPYQQTVTWEMMQQGILTDYSRVYFPDVAHAFWVHNVEEIEVT
jgi:hypothetical protein